jgi:beta-phosphoglucomutase-like phosphatase (HAD superfamily)
VIEATLDALGIRDLFEVVVSGTEVARSKPAPDVFLETARRLGILPARCLVIEDSRNGMLGARAAGMRCAVVPCPTTAGQDFSGANLRLTRLSDLLASSGSERA